MPCLAMESAALDWVGQNCWNNQNPARGTGGRYSNSGCVDLVGGEKKTGSWPEPSNGPFQLPWARFAHPQACPVNALAWQRWVGQRNPGFPSPTACGKSSFPNLRIGLAMLRLHRRVATLGALTEKKPPPALIQARESLVLVPLSF